MRPLEDPRNDSGRSSELFVQPPSDSTELDPYDGSINFIYQERKQSVLSTILEKDTESDSCLNEDFSSKEPEDSKAGAPVVSEMSNKGSKLPPANELLGDPEKPESTKKRGTVRGEAPKTNDQERVKVQKPSPLVIPKIIVQSPDDKPTSFLPQRRTEYEEEVTAKSTAREIFSGLDWDVLGLAYDEDNDDLQATSERDDESLDGFMDCLHYITTCSIL